MRLEGRGSMRSWLGAAIAVALLVPPSGLTPAAAQSSEVDQPILFVHGYSPRRPPGQDCNGFNRMGNTLRSAGWRGPIVRVGFYSDDRNCDFNISSFGAHDGDTHPHNRDTSIDHLGYHLAKFIDQRYTSQRKYVKVIGYSMGGLMIRDAMMKSSRRASGYPRDLLVGDVVTWGSPHGGTNSQTSAACNAAPHVQCNQMKPNSGFLNFLRQYGGNPQGGGGGGTDWTVVGSESDMVIDEASATDMAACHKVRYHDSAGIDHTGGDNYLNQNGSGYVAAGRWDCDDRPWRTASVRVPARQAALAQLISKRH